MVTAATIIGKWFAVWRQACRTYGKTLEAEQIQVYVELLKDIPPPALENACKWCAMHCADFPAVADVRKAYEQAVQSKRETMRALGESSQLPAYDECEFCGGSGWEMMSGCGNVTRCRCVEPGYQLPPPKPRKLLTAEERSEFDDVLKGKRGIQ